MWEYDMIIRTTCGRDEGNGLDRQGTRGVEE